MSGAGALPGAAGQRWRMPTFASFYFWCYAGFLAGYFLFPQAPEHYRYYYLFVLLPLLLRPAQALRSVREDKALWPVFAYIGYMVVTSLWSEVFSWREFAQVAAYGLLVAGFFVATDYVFGSNPQRFDAMLRFLVVLAALAGLLSLLLWYSEHAFPQSRLQPASRMNHEILAGCAYGLFALLALHYYQCSRSRLVRTGFVAVFLLLLATVIFTQSRTAVLALIAAGLFLSGRRGLWLIVFAAALCAALLLYQPLLWEGLTRAMPYRLGIWQVVLEQSASHLLLGTGYLSDATVTVANRSFVHAHNAYLATLRDGGLLGLALLLAVLGMALLRALRLDRDNARVFYLALLLYGVLCAIPDLDRLLTRPSEHWLFFWLPVALAISACRYRAGSGNPQSRVPSNTPL